MTLLIILVGFLNFITFTPAIYSYDLGFKFNGTGSDVQVQEFSSLMLILFVIVNFKSGKVLWRRIFNT
ncbi:hypothetical protein SAMN05444266_103169 [Chitinophaga jiangningensis]|uniref:Uncharacterized protein n=1 Tax=Chitinophaga jiangningensis TaxID=1419482 RepID=A0A1M7A8B4_9BACT|nr:hypothetical protein SAMN05444266_103169 [Chitinophaga jiangningensis]